ncbi:hypothetical protein NSTC745_04258 [Nostoc sp. DSM 114161]|jgi:hypothetical protein
MGGGRGGRGDKEVWGVWGERGERFLPHPPTPPTPPVCPMPIKQFFHPAVDLSQQAELHGQIPKFHLENLEDLSLPVADEAI